jgi:PAS domain S-box-containing protein
MAHDTRAIDQKYRALFEHASDSISVIDSTGLVLDINHRWEALLQRPRSEIVGHHITEFAAPGHAERNRMMYEEAHRQGRAVDLVALQRRDGTVAHLEISTVKVEVDGEVAMFAIGRDVTETIEATSKLEHSERKYRSLIENIPDIVWSATSNGEVTFVSPNVTAITGYTPEELRVIPEQERDPLWRVHPEDRARMGGAFRALVEEGVPIDMEIRARHKNGSFRWVHTRANPIYGESGAIERVDGMYVDVTERKQLEEQARRAQKLEAIGQLVGGVAHDFNNILAVILGNVHFLLDELRDDEPKRKDAEEIKQAAERAAALTRQLLAFSRQQVVAHVALDLGAVAVGLQKMLRRVLSADIKLVIETQPGVGQVRADACQIEQVIMNLAVNARDAMPNGGTLRIETSGTEVAVGAQVGVRSGAAFLPPGRYVRMSVHDTGKGMEGEVKEHLFEPFFTTKGVGKGTGLGLSTCYGIVQQSQGYIGVDSSPGQGTSFHVYFPRIEDDPKAEQSRTSASGRARGNETVLLIEDDPALRRTLQRALDARGYRTLAAASGREAFALVAKERGAVDLVLSDVVLPDIDGFEVTDQLQALMSRAKFVLMSGHSDHALLKDRALEVSPTFMQKPFTPEDMALKLRKVLDA